MSHGKGHRMTSSIILQVRIAAATPIAQAATELVACAVCWNAFVEADFNGCRLMAGPNENPDDLVAIYDRNQALKSALDISPPSTSATWSSPKYPGDAVRLMRFKRRIDTDTDHEIGDVRIQHYGANFRVGTFLPGRHIFNEGDTPKVEPERSTWCSTKDSADHVFEGYVAAAIKEGWRGLS